jgi:hypothetical protein
MKIGLAISFAIGILFMSLGMHAFSPHEIARKEIHEAIRSWFHTNEKCVPDPTGEIYGNGPRYRFYMHSRFRDFMTWFYIFRTYTTNRLQAWINKVPGPYKWEILVDKSEGRMFVYKNDQMIRNYAVSTGSVQGNRLKDGDHRTPEGKFLIFDKKISPIGQNPEAKVVFFNTVWYPNIVIHPGDPYPSRKSAGCINLKSEDMDEFYREIPIGAILVIRE